MTENYRNAERTIELKDVSIGYQTRHKTNIVVAENINATLKSGLLTCLVGPNGIGKSTLMRTITGFQPRLGGEITIDSVSIDDLNDKQLARTISVVLTAKPDILNMNVTEIVGLGRSPYTGFFGSLTTTDHKIVDEAIEMVGIKHLKKRKIHTLSDGERQKVMIAKALAQQTPIIILDEPTAFLDYPSKVEMMLLLYRLSRETNKMIFLSTHDMELALQTADTLWLMNKKELHVGTPRQLADNGELSIFLEHQGIDFDREQLSISVNKKYLLDLEKRTSE